MVNMKTAMNSNASVANFPDRLDSASASDAVIKAELKKREMHIRNGCIRRFRLAKPGGWQIVTKAA
jgi:hypothetical protein